MTVVTQRGWYWVRGDAPDAAWNPAWIHDDHDGRWYVGGAPADSYPGEIGPMLKERGPVFAELDLKSMSAIGYPTGTRRERVLALANGAKHALFGGGCEMLRDDLLIRAALALDRAREGDLAEVAVVNIAVLFSPEADVQLSDETRELLATPLCRPWDGLADAVANNRRLLGLEPQST